MNNISRNSFVKVYWIRYSFGVGRDSYIQKTEIFFAIEFFSTWFLFLRKGKKGTKSKFVTMFEGIKVTVRRKIFATKRLTSKIFATQCSFDDHIRHKIVNKTTCITPNANPHQLHIN